MNYAEAIAALQNSDIDDASEIVKAIQTKYSDLIKNEKKNQKLETQIATLLEAMGIEGEDFEGRLEGANSKVQTLTTELTQAKQSLTETQTKITRLEKQGLIQSAAVKSGAVVEVLDQLLANCPDQLAVGDDGATIGGKSLKEYAESQAGWKPFLPALFPSNTQSQSTQQPTPTTSKLPTGGANGKTEPNSDPVDNYLSSTYKVPDYLKV